MKKYSLFMLLLPFAMPAQFSAAHYIDVAGSTGSIKQFIRTADINADGLKDIVVGNDINEAVRVYINTGNLTFAPAVYLTDIWQEVKSMEVADLDNDGLPDIVTVDSQGSKLYWHKNTAGTFGQETIIASDITFTMGRVLCGDFAGNGNNDILLLNHSNILLFTNDGNGGFSAGQPIVAPDDETEFYDTVKGDFNNDGFPDFAISSGSFDIYLNNGSGQFTKSVAIWGTITMLLEAADYNGDGMDDIVLKNSILKTYLNSGDSFTSTGAFSPNNQNYQSVHSADLDNDGDVDILTEDNQTFIAMWYENNGDGTFQPKQVIHSGAPATSIYGVWAADLDNDGDMEPIWSGGSGVVAFHENQAVLSKTAFNQTSFTIYPNPANSILYIQGSESVANVRIYNTLGQLVLEKTDTAGIDNIAVDQLQPGSYFMEMTSGNNKVTKKLVKQ